MIWETHDRNHRKRSIWSIWIAFSNTSVSSPVFTKCLDGRFGTFIQFSSTHFHTAPHFDRNRKTVVVTIQPFTLQSAVFRNTSRPFLLFPNEKLQSWILWKIINSIINLLLSLVNNSISILLIVNTCTVHTYWINELEHEAQVPCQEAWFWTISEMAFSLASRMFVEWSGRTKMKSSIERSNLYAKYRRRRDDAHSLSEQIIRARGLVVIFIGFNRICTHNRRYIPIYVQCSYSNGWVPFIPHPVLVLFSLCYTHPHTIGWCTHT